MSTRRRGAGSGGGSAGVGRRGRAGWAAAAALAATTAGAALIPVGTAAAQERDSIPGVELGLVFENTYRPALALKPFSARFGGGSAAGAVEAIVGRDLHYSDRFEMMDSLPAGLADEAVDYRLWDRLGAVWLLTGRVEGAGDGSILLLELHDVPYGQVKERGRFRLPNPDDPGFRMAVHEASDAVVRWATGEPGMAASRIAFSMRSPSGVKEVYVIDSDGENLRKLTNHDAITMSPAWAPGGRRVAFMSYKSGFPRIYVRDLESGRETMVDAGREGDHITPAFAPDGRTLAFAVSSGAGSGIFTWDAGRECCLSQVTGGRWKDLSPTYSPDGRWMAFNSNRLGTRVPQIYVMPASGGDADLISPYNYEAGGYYTSPDWSPGGELVAFHGTIRRGFHQILVARVEDRGRRLRQLTWEGNNEDPSWAPDGRHLVFKGERNWGKGLFVVDTATGRIRTLLSGVDVTVPDWSPSLAGDGAAALGGS